MRAALVATVIITCTGFIAKEGVAEKGVDVGDIVIIVKLKLVQNCKYVERIAQVREAVDATEWCRQQRTSAVVADKLAHHARVDVLVCALHRSCVTGQHLPADGPIKQLSAAASDVDVPQ